MQMRHKEKLILIVTLSIFALSAGAVVVAQDATRDVTHVIVLPAVDKTGKLSKALVEKATAAVALALEDVGAYTITSTTDLERTLATMGLRLPLSKAQQLRLAERLHADKIVTPYIHVLRVDPNSGAGVCKIEIQALDTIAEEVTNGGIGEATSRPIPGWDGDVTNVTNELLRQAAELAVRDMERRRVPRGAVEMIDDLGGVHINLGRRDGLAIGHELVVLRGFYRKELDKVVMRKIGTIVVQEVHADRAVARVASGMPPRTGDRVYVLYRPVSVEKAVKQRRKITKTWRWLVALGMLAGAVAVGSGGHRKSAPKGRAYLAQQTVGGPVFIRVENVMAHPVPDPYRTVKGYIIFRGEVPGIDTDDPENIVHVSGERYFRYWDDDTSAVPDKNATKEWTYIGRGGDEEDASYDITYNHRPLEPGHTYYYRIRRIVSPYEPQIPIATGQVRANQAIEWADAEWDFEPSMEAVLSDPSSPLGPVTYIEPALPQEPRDGSTTVNPQEIRFVWNLQTPPQDGGRNARYRLVVFRRDNMTAPVYMSDPIRPTTTTMSLVVRDPDGNIFKPDTDYVWMVGHYVDGEAEPHGPIRGLPLILSQRFEFRTVSTPPGPVGSARWHDGRLIRRGPLGEIRTRRR